MPFCPRPARPRPIAGPPVRCGSSSSPSTCGLPGRGPIAGTNPDLSSRCRTRRPWPVPPRPHRRKVGYSVSSGIRGLPGRGPIVAAVGQERLTVEPQLSVASLAAAPSQSGGEEAGARHAELSAASPVAAPSQDAGAGDPPFSGPPSAVPSQIETFDAVGDVQSAVPPLPSRAEHRIHRGGQAQPPPPIRGDRRQEPSAPGAPAAPRPPSVIPPRYGTSHSPAGS